MPTSNYAQITTITEIISRVNPPSILDVGVGFGKYGFLAREYLELWDEKNEYDKWKYRIDGIEVFKEYLTPMHDFIYDHIYIGNALKILPDIKHEYDLILLIDVLEHFDYKDGVDILDACVKTGRNILISTPKDIGYQGTNCVKCRGTHFENKYETHRFQWEARHFKKYNPVIIADQSNLICFIGEQAPKIRKKIKKREKSELKWRIRNRFPILKYPYRIIKALLK